MSKRVGVFEQMESPFFNNDEMHVLYKSLDGYYLKQFSRSLNISVMDCVLLILNVRYITYSLVSIFYSSDLVKCMSMVHLTRFFGIGDSQFTYILISLHTISALGSRILTAYSADLL